MSVARLIDVADAVVSQIQTTWNPTAPDAVSRVWVARLVFDQNTPGELLTGRRVFVLPIVPAMEAINRSQRLNKHSVLMLVAERYTEAGDPPDSWVDGVVNWWESTIYYPLSAPSLVMAGPGSVVGQICPDPSELPEVQAVVDHDMLIENKCVIIVSRHTFIDLSDFTGAG